MKAIDTEHQFRGYHTDGGVCRLEIYLTDDRPPLIVVTELLDNTNTSVTNMAEFLAAEVLERYLTDEMMAGHDPPFIWVERYQRRPHPTRGTDEDWSLVRFAHYRREKTHRHARRPAFRYAIGEPEWRHLQRADFEALVASYGSTS